MNTERSTPFVSDTINWNQRMGLVEACCQVPTTTSCPHSTQGHSQNQMMWNLARLMVDGIVNTHVYTLWWYMLHVWRMTRTIFETQPYDRVHLMKLWSKVCYMLSWWTKYWPHSINIWDTFINLVSLCSVYQAPSSESNITVLAWFLTFFANLNMLFILEMVCTAHPLKNK